MWAFLPPTPAHVNPSSSSESEWWPESSLAIINNLLFFFPCVIVVFVFSKTYCLSKSYIQIPEKENLIDSLFNINLHQILLTIYSDAQRWDHDLWWECKSHKTAFLTMWTNASSILLFQYEDMLCTSFSTMPNLYFFYYKLVLFINSTHCIACLRAGWSSSQYYSNLPQCVISSLLQTALAYLQTSLPGILVD